MVVSASVTAAMSRADEISRAGLGMTSPNPPVGCVLLDVDGVTIAEGWHRGPGQPHAEVEALRAAGERAAGATAVVTLEPCNHHGRTPPCAQALLAAGVARVVFAHRDPNPKAQGGAETLRAGGVEVVAAGVETATAIRPWLVATGRGRPFVTWKFAATLDGRSAAVDGSSRWITGEQSRRDVHELRGRVDTIVVGVGTVLADDPALTVRLPGLQRAPRRVVVDSAGRTPPDARVLTDGAAETWIATAADVGADEAGKVSLPALFSQLYDAGSRWVLLEGGPTLAGAAVHGGFVDEVVAYVAPALLGAGPAAMGDAGIATMRDIARLELHDVIRLGTDIRISGSFKSQDENERRLAE